MYLPHFAFPFAASKGEMPLAQEDNKMAVMPSIARIFFILAC
jgi:hypothetical protein